MWAKRTKYFFNKMGSWRLFYSDLYPPFPGFLMDEINNSFCQVIQIILHWTFLSFVNHVFKVKVNDTLWHLVEEDEKPNRLEIRVITKKPHTEAWNYLQKNVIFVNKKWTNGFCITPFFWRHHGEKWQLKKNEKNHRSSYRKESTRVVKYVDVCHCLGSPMYYFFFWQKKYTVWIVSKLWWHSPWQHKC